MRVGEVPETVAGRTEGELEGELSVNFGGLAGREAKHAKGGKWRFAGKRMARTAGLEPATFGSVDRRSDPTELRAQWAGSIPENGACGEPGVQRPVGERRATSSSSSISPVSTKPSAR